MLVLRRCDVLCSVYSARRDFIFGEVNGGNGNVLSTSSLLALLAAYNNMISTSVLVQGVTYTFSQVAILFMKCRFNER